MCRELVNHINLPVPHKMTPWQPEVEDKGISSDNEKRVDSSLNAEPSEPHVSNDTTYTKQEIELRNPNKDSSWLTEVLWQTSRLGMDDVVAKLLSLGGDATSTLLQNNVEPHNSTPLHIASRHSHVGTAKLLIAAGASLTSEAKTGWGTPLHYAVVEGSGDIINFLLEKGAPVNAKDEEEEATPLQIACYMGNAVAVEYLLQFRKYQEYLTPDLPQPLHEAAASGYYKIAEALLRYEADPNIQDQDGLTALSVAVDNNNISICRLLLAHKADPNLVSEKSLSPLISSVRKGNLDIVKLLVENGADVNQKEALGLGYQRTPSILNNHFEISEYLLSQMADPELSDADGRTPLWDAAFLGFSEIVRMLAEANTDIHKCAYREWTPLHAAYNSIETVRVLLEYGADINRLTEDDYTPLDLATWHNQPKVVDLMLKESKEKPDLSLKVTQDTLELGVRDGHSEVVSLILEAGANVNLVNENDAPLASIAMPLSDDMMIRTILEYRPDLSMKDKDGNTILHCIGKETPTTSVRLVVNAGGKLDAINNDKDTPLIRAIIQRNMDVFNYLLTKKLVIDTLNIAPFKDSGTPLHFACRWGTLEMVQLLIENGSDINFTCTSLYGTPLIAATSRRNFERGAEERQIVELLLNKGADPTLSAGLFGYPIISASLSSTEIIQWLLDRRVSVDVKDTFGRKPAHLACYNSLEVLNMLQIPDSDFAVKDIVGRVPLHYAVLSCQLDLVEEVLARSERVGIGIDVCDNDGWTPLLWAARASGVRSLEKRNSSLYDEVVSLLLDKKANSGIRGSGLYKDWTVSEVAYYHNADRSKSLIWPQHKFKELGYDWDTNDSASEAAQSDVDKPASEKKIVNEEENMDNQFDDEIIDEDDLKEQEMELLQEKK
ncbi:hypothetical protein ACHAQJ_005254 [Trichoderma viride]